MKENGNAVRFYLHPVQQVKPYIEQLKGKKAKETFDALKDRVDFYGKTPGLEKENFRFHPVAKRIFGSNIPLLILMGEVLAEDGARTPTLVEAMLLNKKGIFGKGLFRDFGIVSYGEQLYNPFACSLAG